MNEALQQLPLRIEAQKLEKAAFILKAIGHPIRLAILDLLDQTNQMHVSELQEKLDIEQALLSHHLIKMKDKGVLLAVKKGKYIYYSIADPSMIRIIDCIAQCKAL
jgi:DNA-binding transcriptional ArsR family regulator